MQQKPINHYVDRQSLALVMSPHFIHQGFDEAVSQIEDAVVPKSFLLGEAACNKVFSSYMAITLKRDFLVGYINTYLCTVILVMISRS